MFLPDLNEGVTKHLRNTGATHSLEAVLATQCYDSQSSLLPPVVLPDPWQVKQSAMLEWAYESTAARQPGAVDMPVQRESAGSGRPDLVRITVLREVALLCWECAKRIYTSPT